jgi:hypothetical protein
VNRRTGLHPRHLRADQIENDAEHDQIADQQQRPAENKPKDMGPT